MQQKTEDEDSEAPDEEAKKKKKKKNQTNKQTKKKKVRADLRTNNGGQTEARHTSRQILNLRKREGEG